MATVKCFKELTVWQRSIELTTEIYRLTQAFPREEIFGLTSQLRRAAVSVASNIAEGHSRATKGEYVQFLGIARGSTAEVETQLTICRNLKIGNEAAFARCESLSTEVGKMLSALVPVLRSNR